MSLLHMIYEANKKSYLNPFFISQHRAQEFIAASQTQGQMKKCAHINIITSYPSKFTPDCKKKSFDQERTYEGIRFFGCPSNCTFYVPSWQKPIRMLFSWLVSRPKLCWQFLWNITLGLGKWFAQLSIIIQLIIVLCPPLYIGAKNADKVANMAIKIIRATYCIDRQS